MEMNGKNLRKYREQLGLSQANISELTGIAQYLISAFELEKINLPKRQLGVLQKALEDEEKVSSLATRGKRLQERKYIEVPKVSDRVSRASQTPGNIAYRKLLDEIDKKHSVTKDGTLRALSLFSGCGGFSLGFTAAGFSMIGFLEIDPQLRNIYKLNFPNTQELGDDITKVSDAKLAELKTEIGCVDVIIGGPPCQGFSLSGKRKIDDPRNALFRHYLRFVDAFQPKLAFLENVRVLTSMKNPDGGFVKDDICDEFRKHGYKVKYFEINAKHYGVPQHRERVFFVAVRNDLEKQPSIPALTHGKDKDLVSDLDPFRTFADACSDLPYLESGEKSHDSLHEAVRHPIHVIDWLWDVPEGCTAHDNDDQAKRPPSGYNTTYKRQIWNEPASTVQTTFGMISGCRNVHPIATRSLTIREAARIQSFPDSFKFAGSLGNIRTGIGNAVPPLLAYHLGLHAKFLLGHIL